MDGINSRVIDSQFERDLMNNIIQSSSSIIYTSEALIGDLKLASGSELSVPSLNQHQPSMMEDTRFSSSFSCLPVLSSDPPSPIFTNDLNNNYDINTSSNNESKGINNSSPQERQERNMLDSLLLPTEFDTPIYLEDARCFGNESEDINYSLFITSSKNKKFPSGTKTNEGSSCSLLEHKRDSSDLFPADRHRSTTPPRFPQLAGVAMDTPPTTRSKRAHFDEAVITNDTESIQQSSRSLMDKIAGLDTDRNVLSLLERMERQVQELKSRYKKINGNDSDDNNSQASNALSIAVEGVSNGDNGMSGSGKDADLVDAYLQLNKEVQELIAFKRATTGSPEAVTRRSSKMSLSSRCESDEWKLEHDYRNSSFSFDLTSNNLNNNNSNNNLNNSSNNNNSAEHFMIKHKYLSLLPIKNNALLVVQKTYSDQSIPDMHQKLSHLVHQQPRNQQQDSLSRSTMEDDDDNGEVVEDGEVTVLNGSPFDHKMRRIGHNPRSKANHSVKDHRNDSIVNALHHSADTSARSGNLPVDITNPTNPSLKAASEGREKRMKERERRERSRYKSLTVPAEVIPSSSLPFVSPNAMPKRLSRHSQLFLFGGDSEPTLACSTADDPHGSAGPSVRPTPTQHSHTHSRLHYVSVPDDSDEETDRDVSIRLSELPTHSSSLTRLFEIHSKEVFDGMYMKKKYTSNMFFKRRFVWVCPSTRSLHWAKSEVDRSEKLKSKFLLVRMTRGKLPSGYFQGVVHCLGVSGSGLRLCTESGKFLDLQIPASSVKRWEKVLIALM